MRRPLPAWKKAGVTRRKLTVERRRRSPTLIGGIRRRHRADKSVLRLADERLRPRREGKLEAGLAKGPPIETEVGENQGALMSIRSEIMSRQLHREHGE